MGILKQDNRISQKNRIKKPSSFPLFLGNMINSHIIQLLLILSASWFLGRYFQRKFDLPPMLGELIAGLIFGPPVLNIITPSEYIDFLAELGIFFLMFYAGTETDPKSFFKSMKPSLLCGVFGFIIPFASGYFGSQLLMPQITNQQALFMGLGLSITAIAVNARILLDLNLQNSEIANVLIGAALVDDILSLGVFSALVDTVETGHITLEAVLTSTSHVILFFLITYALGRIILPLLNRLYLEEGGHGFTFSLLTALVFAFIAEWLGLHLIIGAFLAGLFVREEIKKKRVLDRLNDRLMIIGYGFLGPIFFVSLAFHVDLMSIVHQFWFLLAILLIALAGKFAGSYLGCLLAGMEKSKTVIVSAGMNGRGAVELIIVSVGVSLGILTKDLVSVLVSMAFLTTLATPLAFKFLLKYYKQKGVKVN
ncbi:MAG: hypothetical protein GF334_05310 [Candidatus Altiarchaeales archaeon]|nr:hypothetical protein [Candidatus Altiarchaeales archaeon]